MDDLRGFVYFIRSAENDLIKIGFTQTHPSGRLQRLEATCPTKLEPIGFVRGDIELERQLHSRFADSWSHGEWFRASGDLERFMSESAETWDYQGRAFTRRLPAAKQPLDGSPGRLPNHAIHTLRRRDRYYRLTFDGRTQTVMEWAAELEIPLAKFWRSQRSAEEIIGERFVCPLNS